MIDKNTKSSKLPKLHIREILNMTEIYMIIGLVFMLIQSIIFFFHSIEVQQVLTTNILIVLGIITVAYIDTHYTKGSFFRLTRRIYLMPVIFILYTQSQIFIPIVNPHLFDGLIAKWDLALFGCYPNDVLYKIANPWLTEYLQFCYMNYFVIFFLIALELHFLHDDKHFKEFCNFVFFSFILMYVCYYVLPAIGPRFYLYDFLNLNNDLPGKWFTNVFRDIINTGGGIPKGGVPNPQDYIYRDCMPSGHTWITVICIYYVIKHRMKLAWYVIPVGTGLILSTVYMRYHYLIDVIMGIAFATFSLLIEPLVARLFKNVFKFKNI